MVLSALGQLCAAPFHIVKRDHLGKTLHAVNGMRVELAQRFTGPGAHFVNTFSEHKRAERNHGQKRHQHQRHDPAEIKQHAHHQRRHQHRHKSRRHSVRKEILHELNVVGCHPHHIARTSSYHISRS